MEDIQILEQQINNAPEEIRKFIAEEKWISVVEDMVKKDTLSPDQQTSLQNEILFVLVGLDLFSNLEKNVTESLAIDSNLAKAIVAELNERIFGDIKSFLPTGIDDSGQSQSPAQLEKPDLESLPPVKSTTLEIPPQMSVVPEGKVMDHLPPITPTQPKPILPPILAPIVSTIPVAPIVNAPKEIPIVPSPAPSASYTGKDPYREPLE